MLVLIVNKNTHNVHLTSLRFYNLGLYCVQWNPDGWIGINLSANFLKKNPFKMTRLGSSLE